MLFTITTLWANSADDILMIFSPENRIWHFMQIISLGDNLHVMSKPVFWEKQEKYFKMVSAENLPRVLSVKDMVLKVWTDETKCSYFCYVCLVVQLDENYWTWLDEIIAFMRPVMRKGPLTHTDSKAPGQPSHLYSPVRAFRSPPTEMSNYSKCPKLLYAVSDKIRYANSADTDQTAPAYRNVRLW